MSGLWYKVGWVRTLHSELHACPLLCIRPCRRFGVLVPVCLHFLEKTLKNCACLGYIIFLCIVQLLTNDSKCGIRILMSKRITIYSRLSPFRLAIPALWSTATLIYRPFGLARNASYNYVYCTKLTLKYGHSLFRIPAKVFNASLYMYYGRMTFWVWFST